MRTPLPLLILVLLLLVAGCGDGDGDTSAGDEVPGPTGAPDDGTLGAGPYPIADLTISVTLAPSVSPTVSRISCLGDTATVTGDATGIEADTMCLTLDDDVVRALLFDGPPPDRICTEQYGGPEVATITGTLDDNPVDATIDRANGCGIGDWNTLSGLLPPA